jgi:hypothetical protein
MQQRVRQVVHHAKQPIGLRHGILYLLLTFLFSPTCIWRRRCEIYRREMLESRLFTHKAFPRLCSTAAGLRRHRLSHSTYTLPNNRSSTEPHNNFSASRLFSTSRAQFCGQHHNLCNHTSAAVTFSSTQQSRTMSSNPEKRPEVGAGSGHLEEEPSKQDDDWKNRPPYRTTAKDEEFHKEYTAHCHCGRVKYWLSRKKPLGTKFCHCVDCQALHGTSRRSHTSS